MKRALQPTAALALALLANTSQAQDDSTLSTVVVTGNRGAERLPARLAEHVAERVAEHFTKCVAERVTERIAHRVAN